MIIIIGHSCKIIIIMIIIIEHSWKIIIIMIIIIMHMCKYQQFMNRQLISAQPHPNLETILVVLEEVCELLGRRHPVVVEGSVPRREVLEGKLVCLR